MTTTANITSDNTPVPETIELSDVTAQEPETQEANELGAVSLTQNAAPSPRIEDETESELPRRRRGGRFDYLGTREQASMAWQASPSVMKWGLLFAFIVTVGALGLAAFAILEVTAWKGAAAPTSNTLELAGDTAKIIMGSGDNAFVFRLSGTGTSKHLVIEKQEGGSTRVVDLSTGGAAVPTKMKTGTLEGDALKLDGGYTLSKSGTGAGLVIQKSGVTVATLDSDGVHIAKTVEAGEVKAGSVDVGGYALKKDEMGRLVAEDGDGKTVAAIDSDGAVFDSRVRSPEVAVGVDNSTVCLKRSEVGSLKVDKGVEAAGGFRDSHSWSSGSRRRAELALAYNQGGFGSSAYTGGTMKVDWAWEAYDAGMTDGLVTKGFEGAVFDGRYIYFAPYAADSATKTASGAILRFDTHGNFKSRSNYAAYDARNTDGLLTAGYIGAAYDGRYVYFVSHNDGSSNHGRILRYDTQGDFGSSSSFSAFDAGNIDGLVTKEFIGAVFDGHYVYYVPYRYEPQPDGRILRYDTGKDFKSTTSYSAFDAGNTDGLSTKGYFGGVYDGRYVYFVPGRDSGPFHGRILRYDTRGNFKSSSSYSAFDAGQTDGMSTKGFIGGVFDGRYVYFVPNYSYDTSGVHGHILRYDTRSDFKSSYSYAAFDSGNVDGMNAKGFHGAAYDGRYIYFAPHGDSPRHGIVLRYDTLADFKSSSSYATHNAGNVDGLVTVGFTGTVFDGRYVFFVPFDSGSNAFHGHILRYDTRAPQPRPSLSQLASTDDVFLSSHGNLGIGTKDPKSRLQIGTANDSTVARANSWQEFSDANHKTNIQPLNQALETVLQLRGVRFNWKGTNEPSLGFTAQELEKVLPELVSGEEGSKSVNYGRLSAVLVAALQEEHRLLVEQEAVMKKREIEIEKQKKELEELREKLNWLS